MKNEISLLTLGLGVAFAPLASAELLTENTVEDRNPLISGDLIVWESRVAAPEVIPDPGPDGAGDDLEGDPLVDDSGDDPLVEELDDFEIMVSKGGITRQITDNEGDDLNAGVSNGNVVWQSWDGADWEIWVYNFKCDCLRQVTDNAVDDINPQIDGNRIVWQVGEGAATEIASDLVGLETVDVVTRIMPTSLNPKSRGKWVTATFAIAGEETTVADVNLSTIFLEGDIPAVSARVSKGAIKMKFSRSALVAKLAGIQGEVELTISAETLDGTGVLSGIATIRVLPTTSR